ncbi:MAG: tetratricopeptide repeat protein, partial [Nitrospirota bacterium]
INILDMKGSIYQAKKDYKAALSEYKNMKIIAHERGAYKIAALYGSMGEYDHAIEELKELADKKSDKASIMSGITSLYVKKKDFKEAEKTAKTIISSMPDNVFGYEVLAGVYIAENYLQEAVYTLKKAAEMSPANIEIQMMLGRTYMSMKDMQNAMKTFQGVEKLNPGYALAYFFQGNVLELTGDRKGAVEKYKKVLEFAPNYVPVLNNLAYLYTEGYGPINEAVDMAYLAKKSAPNDGSVTDTLGWALFKKGDYDNALKYFIEATYYISGNPTLRYHLGLTYLKKGMTEKAEKQLKNAVRLGESSGFPELNDAKKALGELKR